MDQFSWLWLCSEPRTSWYNYRHFDPHGSRRISVQHVGYLPPVKRPSVGSRALPVAGPKTWNALPEYVTSQSEYTFRHQLKMWLFKKFFLDIIIRY